MSEITGTLREARVFDWYGSIVASGKVYGDTRGRFPDGEEVTTSKIVAFNADNQTIVTRNSIYKLEPWPDLIRCPHCYGVFGRAEAADPIKPVTSLSDFARDDASDDEGLAKAEG